VDIEHDQRGTLGPDAGERVAARRGLVDLMACSPKEVRNEGAEVVVIVDDE
jgi:hypothetical protein